MTFKKTAFTAAALAILTSTSASAADTARVGAGLGLFGPMLEAQIPINGSFTVRGSIAGGISASGTTTADGLDYSVNANIGATTLMGTYHLPAGLRLSGGVMMPNTTINGTVSNPGGGSVGGSVVASPFSIESTTQFANSIAPMATFGFDVPLFGAVLSTDAGIVNTGGFNVTLTETTSGGNVIPSADLTTAESTIESDLSGYRYIPYVSIVIGKWF